MSRNDAHLDAMLRHLGAAYYDSLHGRAAQADVARALDTVADQLGEEFPKHPASARSAAAGRHDQASKHHQHHGRWHSRVRDVMTTSVVTVDRITPYKEIARLLAEHKISAVPVLIMGRHVAGVVSEADLLTAQDQAARRARTRGKRAPALAAPRGRAASAPHRGTAHVLAGDHDQPGCADFPGGRANARPSRQAAAGGRPGQQGDRHRWQADRHRQPA